MQYLLDTHALLWTIFEPEKLTEEAREIIGDHNNVICISLISLWEISIKQNIGRLEIPDNFFQVVHQGGFKIISLTLEEIARYKTLPLHHRDPFDRMLVVQAQERGLTLITRDSKIAKYEVQIIKS